MRYSKSTSSKTVKLKGYRSSKPKKAARVTPAGAYAVINDARSTFHDRTITKCAVPKYINIGGIPHKVVDGVTVPLVGVSPVTAAKKRAALKK